MARTLDVNDALDEAFVPRAVTETIVIDEFVVGDEAFAVQAPASYSVVVTALEDGVLAQGEVTLPVRAVCVRCLEPFDTAITSPIDSMFYFTETLDEDGDPYPMVDEYGHIDLETEVIEDLIVAAPLAPIHDQDCKGLCPLCGANRNTDPCTCDVALADENHPFAGLEALLDAQAGCEESS